MHRQSFQNPILVYFQTASNFSSTFCERCIRFLSASFSFPVLMRRIVSRISFANLPLIGSCGVSNPNIFSPPKFYLSIPSAKVRLFFDNCKFLIGKRVYLLHPWPLLPGGGEYCGEIAPPRRRGMILLYSPPLFRGGVRGGVNRQWLYRFKKIKIN